MKRVQLARDERQVFLAAQEAALALGFELCAYFMSIPLPVSRPKLFAINNYPQAWREHYARAGYLRVDPSVAHCRRSERPVVWNDELFAAVPQLWADARAHGLQVGWAQGTRASGGPLGMLTLARRSRSLTAGELHSKEHLMSFLTSAVHDAMVRAHAPRLGWPIAPCLTDREIETLRWTADGKTTADVAGILGVSDNTVKFHIKNATAKLQVANKTAAVARAAMLGWLH